MNIAAKTLGLINLLCGTLHLAFEVVLLKNNGPYRGFLLMENLLIALVFLAFFAGIRSRSHEIRHLSLKLQRVWWAVFILLVLCFWGATSTLSMFLEYVSFSEPVMLLTSAGSALLLCMKALWNEQGNHSN